MKEVTSETELSEVIIDAIQDIKGANIVKIDMRKVQDAPAEYFIICEGESVTKINAIANNIQKRLKNELGLKPGHMEGGVGAKWILLDYFSILVHIFYPETRAFYDLEELWSDGLFTNYENL